MAEQIDLFKQSPSRPPEVKGWSDMEWWSSDKMKTVTAKLEARQSEGATIFPSGNQIFMALDLTPLMEVRVVILGQDPYHTPGKANGLAFSVRPGVRHPPSLINIFKELENDIGCDYPENGDLTPWALQGVLLLNTILTVEEGKPLSHRGYGWEGLTTEVIRTVLLYRRNVVFILWGNTAIGSFLEAYRHCPHKIVPQNGHELLKSPHPSPMSASGGFFGSKPFSRTNEWLKKTGTKEIDWCLK
jgi:uracil-DNA glycosylase